MTCTHADGAYVLPGPVSSSLKSIMKKMLCVRPAKRATARDLLSHAWLGKLDKDKQPGGSGAAAAAASPDTLRPDVLDEMEKVCGAWNRLPWLRAEGRGTAHPFAFASMATEGLRSVCSWFA
jgi:hypothetical protein